MLGEWLLRWACVGCCAWLLFVAEVVGWMDGSCAGQVVEVVAEIALWLQWWDRSCAGLVVADAVCDSRIY